MIYKFKALSLEYINKPKFSPWEFIKRLLYKLFRRKKLMLITHGWVINHEKGYKEDYINAPSAEHAILKLVNEYRLYPIELSTLSSKEYINAKRILNLRAFKEKLQ